MVHNIDKNGNEIDISGYVVRLPEVYETIRLIKKEYKKDEQHSTLGVRI